MSTLSNTSAIVRAFQQIAEEARTRATKAKPAPRPAFGTPVPGAAAARRPVPVSWAELRISQSQHAIAYLRGIGFSVSRELSYPTLGVEPIPTGRFFVSGYTEPLDRMQLLALAKSRGFEA